MRPGNKGAAELIDRLEKDKDYADRVLIILKETDTYIEPLEEDENPNP